MHTLSSFVSFSVAVAYAQDLDQKLPLRYLRRGVPFANTTIVESNLTSTSTVVTASTISLSTSISSSIPLDTGGSTNPLPSTTSTSTLSSQGSPAPTYTNATSEEPTCTGSVTYFGSVPPTIFLTVTEGFDVTVSATNASATASETLITPLPACEATIMPLDGTMTLESTSYSEAGSKSANQPDVLTGPSPAPAATGRPLASLSASLVYSSYDYTSTVVVTKKTPVTVVAPPTTSPAVNFQNPTTANGAGNSSPPPATGAVTGGGGSGGSGGSSGSSPGAENNNNNNNNNNNPTSGGESSESHGALGGNNPTRSSNEGGASFPTVSNSAQTTGTLSPASTTSFGLGNIIASIIYSGFAPPSRTSARTTTVNGVPLIVLPSSVVIGDQSFAIPNSASTSVQVNGVGFELRPSEIIAPAATITVPQVQQDQMLTITPRPSSTVVTIGDGLVITVSQTVAVISGTTYRIGHGALATTFTIDGTTISVGPNGVGLPRTTVSPATATATGYVIYTVEGLVFSVDDNEAVISSTTYRIGSNAPHMTTVIGGETVSFGPGGIGLESTTIAPTTVASRTASAGSRSTTPASSSATESADMDSAASIRLRIPISEMLGWYLMAACILCYLSF